MGELQPTHADRQQADGIFAAATPPGAAERAVIRISGSNLLSDLARLLPSGWPLPSQLRSNRCADVGKWQWHANAALEVATFCFAAPHSATGEDVVELHFPGNAVLMEQIEAHLRSVGLRTAEAGEFTRRAFLNGKLDLAQAEAVLDLIHSRTAEQAVAAAAVLGGSLGGELQIARDALVHALVQLEAGLDFEEGDSQDVTPEEVQEALQTATAALARGEHGERRRQVEQGEFWNIALVGAANAGKTSLYRRLTGAEALVSDIAGTTRDRLQAEWPRPPAWQNRTRPWQLCDLPGLGGEAQDHRDAAARRRVERDRFDLQLLVLDGSDSQASLPQPLPDIPAVWVVSKGDLPNCLHEDTLRQVEEYSSTVWVSSASGAGLETLAGAVGGACLEAEHQHATTLRAVERHCQALGRAAKHVDQAAELVAIGGHQDLVAEEIRAAIVELAELAGEFTPEDLLDQLFGEFCVGK